MFDLRPLAYVIQAIGLIVVLGSILLVAALFKGKMRIAAICVVAASWAFLYIDKIQKPAALNEARAEWRRGAVARCTKELAELPAKFNVDGFVDEGGAMRKRVIQQLFAERKIRFIEIRPRRTEGQIHIAYPNGSYEDMWLAPDFGAPYIRIELGAFPDPRCIMKLPYWLDFVIGRAPFLPETCVIATSQATANAQIALTLDPAEASTLGRYGSWQIVDRQTGTRLAALSTFDSNDAWVQSRSDGLSSARRKVDPDCRAPYTELVDRIYGPEAFAPSATPQVLMEERIESSTDILQIGTTGSMRDVHATAEEFFYSDEESWQIFTPEIRQSEWQATVDQARELGLVAYGSRLLDWKSRRLISLAFTRKENPHPWQALAASGGFFVHATAPSWHEQPSNLLVRYRKDGTLAWAVNVMTPAKRGRPCNFWPQAIFIEGHHLVLADRCSKLGEDEAKAVKKANRGEKWRIPLSDLPNLD